MNSDRVLNFVIILIILCSTLPTTDMFADTTIYPKWISSLLLVFLYALYGIVIMRKKYRINKLYMSVFAFILYLVIHSICFPSAFRDGIFCSLFGFFILYSLFSFYIPQINSYYFYNALCLAAVVQSIISIIQFLAYSTIVGTNDNSTGLAISLVCIFPFMYFYYKTINSSWKRWFYRTGLALNFIIILLSGCRASIIAIVVVICFIVFSRKYIVIIIGISVTLLLTINYKINSTQGRAFIYQTSIRMIDSGTLLLGKGHGGFKREYMIFQAKEFECNANSPNAILADNVSHPLNEYLLLLIEYGVTGCILVLVVSILFLKHADRNSSSFLYILTIAILACFSYPFRYPLTIVLLAYSLATINCKNVYSLKVTKMFKVIAISGVCLGMLYLAFDIRNHYFWKKQIALCSIGKTEKTLPIYDMLYSSLNNNPYFLYNYSATLHLLGNYQKSNNILSCCNLYLNDYDTELLRADNCYALKSYKEAEYYYIQASYMCPNRFQPIYQLMRLYKDCNNMKQARQMAEEIVKKKIKVPSTQVDKIIQEANSFLTDAMKYD